jgi:hypothetical protein
MYEITKPIPLKEVTKAAAVAAFSARGSFLKL